MGSVCHVGMDAHKDTLTIATARGQEEARFFGAIPNTQAALDSFVRKPGDRVKTDRRDAVKLAHL